MMSIFRNTKLSPVIDCVTRRWLLHIIRKPGRALRLHFLLISKLCALFLLSVINKAVAQPRHHQNMMVVHAAGSYSLVGNTQALKPAFKK
jgi:hypothetical protein